MWYLAIFMTPHFKQKERNNGVWGLGWGKRGGGSQNFLSYIWGGGSRIYFKRISGVVKCFAHHVKM